MYVGVANRKQLFKLPLGFDAGGALTNPEKRFITLFRKRWPAKIAVGKKGGTTEQCLLPLHGQGDSYLINNILNIRKEKNGKINVFPRPAGHANSLV